MDTACSDQWIGSPSPSSHEQYHGAACSPAPPKRPAGRTKFKETRHPVYRGVRRRGSAGRWVCEVRVPGKHGKRLWLGTYLTADSAARGHDAGMLTLRGPSSSNGAACLLNFPDSAWLLAVPCALPRDAAGIRRAAVAAVADFQRRQVVTVPLVHEIVSSASVLLSSMDDAVASSWASLLQVPSEIAEFDVPVVPGGGGTFELDMYSETDLGVYYADLAEALLMEPPQTTPDDSTGACWESGDYGDGGADAALWDY